MSATISTMASLIVLGSANIDYTAVVDRHPEPGETVLATDFVVGTGGKGANQALGAAREGFRPLMVAAVGGDSTGSQLLEALEGGGVDTSEVTSIADAPTGIALITVSSSGQNSIVVVAGANGRLDVEASAAAVARHSHEGSVVLAQLEIPLAVVSAAAVALSARGGRLVLNLSPAATVPDELLELCDPLIVNESEAEHVAGRPVNSVSDALATAESLLQRCRSVVITLGGEGAVHASRGGGASHIPAPAVTVVDTTGAGDAFAGALAGHLSNGATLAKAVAEGVAAGAKAVQWVGAQPPA